MGNILLFCLWSGCYRKFFSINSIDTFWEKIFETNFKGKVWYVAEWFLLFSDCGSKAYNAIWRLGLRPFAGTFTDREHSMLFNQTISTKSLAMLFFKMYCAFTLTFHKFHLPRFIGLVLNLLDKCRSLNKCWKSDNDQILMTFARSPKFWANKICSGQRINDPTKQSTFLEQNLFHVFFHSLQKQQLVTFANLLFNGKNVTRIERFCQHDSNLEGVKCSF